MISKDMIVRQYLTLSIADIGVTVVCNDANLTEMVCQHYSLFTRASQADFTLTIDPRYRHSGPISPHLKVLNVSELIEVIPIADSDGLAPIDYTGLIDLQHNWARLSFAASSPIDEIEYFLRVVYALLIFRSGGVMLHAAGILQGGRVHAFFGHSGVGKSTVARLSAPGLILNDDLIAFLPSEKGWMVYATPFWNPTQTRPNLLSGPLAGIYRLVQDERVYIELMSPGTASAELLASVPVIPDLTSKNQELIRRCLEIQEQVPVKYLHFLPDTTFWQAITAEDSLR